jgi:hypothetical protein
MRGHQITLGLLPMLALGCGGGGNGAAGASSSGKDGGSDNAQGGASAAAPAVFGSATCRMSYPAHACDGDPHGKWSLAGICANLYEGCRGASVKPSGTATASIDFQDGSPVAYFEYNFEYDIETRLSVPLSCLKGASCESIGCFAGDDPCSCVVGDGNGGFIRQAWMPNVSGEVASDYSSGSDKKSLRFCASATTADSVIEGTRVIWNRVCTENADCRPDDPCHVGKEHCAGDRFACEDTGSNRPVGTPCGTDKVCDAGGACIACAAGGTCSLPDQPCKTATISCSTAAPVCVASANVADGTACGTGRMCMNGMCKANDGEPCASDAECKDSCVCGDAKCSKRYCGESCVCHYAPPGGACGDPLADGTEQPSLCDGEKGCYRGQCLTKTGIYCNTDSECGTGHCTCLDETCIRLLCSPVDCPCQWAYSESKTCGGALMDGLHDLSCQPPKMCMQGKCR